MWHSSLLVDASCTINAFPVPLTSYRLGAAGDPRRLQTSWAPAPGRILLGFVDTES